MHPVRPCYCVGRVYYSIVNTADQGVRKVAQISYPGLTNEVEVLNADGNNLSSLAGLERYPALIQVSKQNCVRQSRDNNLFIQYSIFNE